MLHSTNRASIISTLSVVLSVTILILTSRQTNNNLTSVNAFTSYSTTCTNSRRYSSTATTSSSSSSSSSSTSSTSLQSLNKKSTATDVLKYLNSEKKLAPYVTKSGTRTRTRTRTVDSNENSDKSMGVAVVTGATSGIGIPTVRALAVAGMKVVLCARDVSKGTDVLSKELPSYCQANVRVQQLDLADMASVESAAKEIVAKEGSINVLLNNGGVMAPPSKLTTEQGLELQFGVNHIGHFQLTRLLLPYIQDGGRIVNVASTAHTFGTLDFSDLNYNNDAKRPYSGWGAYGQSKLSNVLFAKVLNDKLKEEGKDIVSVSLHPGVIGTNLWQYTAPSFLRPLLNAVVADKTAEQGAATSVYCSLVDANSAFPNGGEYVSDCAVTEPSPAGKDENKSLRTKLWDASESIVQEAGFQLPSSLL